MLLRRREKGVAIERLATGGTPVGLLPMAQYEEGAIALQPGDTLICFSDGISEACNSKGEFWRESQIEDLLRKTADSSAQEITERVVGGADAFTGDAEQADDMTVVTLRILS
jgi:sigma-B regulation protein RsbU (phosphoserine phosphatase)